MGGEKRGEGGTIMSGMFVSPKARKKEVKEKLSRWIYGVVVLVKYIVACTNPYSGWWCGWLTEYSVQRGRLIRVGQQTCSKFVADTSK